MNSIKTEISGYDKSEAVRRFLQLHGIEQNFNTFKENYSINSVEDMTTVLDLYSFPSRCTVVNCNELHQLSFPVIAECIDNSYVIIKGKKRSVYTIDSAAGELFLNHNAIEHCITENILESMPLFPEGSTFLHRFGTFLSLHKKTLVQIVLGTFLLQILMLVIPELTSVVLNRALPDTACSTLTLVSLGILSVTLYIALTGWIRGKLVIYLNSHFDITFQRGFLNHLIHLPFHFLQRKTIGELIQAIHGLSVSKEIIGGHAVSVLFDGLFSIMLLAAMFIKMPHITIIVIFFSVLICLFLIISGKFQASLQTRVVKAQSRQQGFLSEIITGFTTIKATGAQKQGLKHWMRFFGEELSFSLKKNRLELWAETGISTFQQAVMIIIIVCGGYSCLSGITSIGTVFSYLQLTSGFLAALFGLVNFFLMVMILKPQTRHTNEILHAQITPKILYRASQCKQNSIPVVMKDVWFRYTSDSSWVLKNYNLDIKAGEKYHITDASGSGKTTILRLLSGLYTTESGSVLTGNLSPKMAQNKIIYIPQFIQLYSGSIMENLKIFSGNAYESQLTDMSIKTGLDKIVSAFPMKYGTIVTHGGKNLSGGQRQLIVLTAALAADRPLMLLDEPMANIDAVRSEFLHQLIDSLNCTVIMARHGSKKHII